MQITIDTSNITDLDLAVLAVLSNGGAAPTQAAVEAPAAAKKAAAKPAPKAKKAAAKPAPEPEPEVEEELVEEEEELIEPAASGATMAQAVALATKMVSNGKAPAVKAALAEVGASRVSEVSEDDLDAFIAALS